MTLSEILDCFAATTEQDPGYNVPEDMQNETDNMYEDESYEAFLSLFGTAD